MAARLSLFTKFGPSVNHEESISTDNFVSGFTSNESFISGPRFLTFWVGHESFGESDEKCGFIFQEKYVMRVHAMIFPVISGLIEPLTGPETLT